MADLRTLPSRTAFLLGLSFTLLPAFGPFVAALLLFSRRWSLTRRDALWGAAALAFGLAAWFGSGPVQGLVGLATVAGPWIVFRTFAELKRMDGVTSRRSSLGLGLLIGFAVVVGAGLLQAIQGVDFGASRTVTQAIAWESPPALYGHTVLVLGGIIALLAHDARRVAWAAMGLAAFGILISGSLEAAVAWLVLAVLQIATREAGARRPRLPEVAALLVMLGLASGLAPLLGWGQVGFLLTPGEEEAPGRNLFVGTEVAGGDWWDDRWVEVDSTLVTLNGRDLTAFEVRKRGNESWLRLQQVVRLQPGTTYTLSGWIEAQEDRIPGFQGWAQLPSADRTFVLSAALRNGEWHAVVSGPGEIIGSEELARDGNWHRLAVTFHYDGDGETVPWFVGFTPDAQRQAGTSSRVAGLQLEVAERAGPYEPGPASEGLAFAYARAPLWRTAWQGIQARPWVGWGEGSFADLYRTSNPTAERQQVVPAHPHNQFLLTLFERGVLGLLGLVLLLVALFGQAVRYPDLGLLAVVLAVLIANTFDATLLSGGVLYPLAAVAGWRSAHRTARRRDGAEGARQVTVRLTLAGADLFATGLALWIAQRSGEFLGVPVNLDASHMYALLIWPAISWREGLFPGYGLTPAQELKNQMAACATAGILFAVGARLFPGMLAVPAVPLAIFIVLTFVAIPVGRAASKRLLHAMNVWGRPVAILGAGQTGRRVARSLTRSPLDGLHPVAFFDDDPDLRGRRVNGLRIRGSLRESEGFALRHGVRHAIVAIPSLSSTRLDQLTNTGERAFRHIQFLPRIQGMAHENVRASDLDGMLALEVKIGLASPLNRLVKRVFDVAAVVLGGILASPVLLCIAAAIYIDSPGSILFGHTRIGQGGRRFTTWKFRSMIPNSEDTLRQYLAHDPKLRAEWEANQKLQHDPRVTRVGSFLRSTSLDELPQIWNVLVGDMSLVGPRPIVDEEVDKYQDAYALYKMVRPGITGYWQVSGRSDTSYENRVAMDTQYVRNWSIWLDIIVLVRTVAVVIRKRGAY